jgi:hypothetical protein
MTGPGDRQPRPGSASDTPDLGETFVAGKDQATARALLAACDTLGVQRWSVRTGARGFVVPNAVYDQYASDQASTQYGI